MKKSGMSRRAFLTIGPEIIDGDGAIKTESNTWYVILKKANNTALPAAVPLNAPFRSPADGADQFTLAAGDQLIKFDFERYCKTAANWTMEQGSIDIGDDCDPGATMRDGVTAVSGSLSGFFVFDDATEAMIDVSQKIFNLFVPFMEDDGKGGYSYNQPSDQRIYVGFCLNGDAGVGKIENWFITPITINSVAASGGNTDAQTMEISWSKGQGLAVSYNVPRSE